MRKQRLTIEDRMLIAQLLRHDYKQKDIANAVGVHPSTISREIKKRRTHNNKDDLCDKTNRYPFVCSNCPRKTNCRKRMYYYGYASAQENYEKKLKYSRVGIDMTIDEIQYWDDFFRDRLMIKNQPILHIYKNIENEFPKSIQTLYNYIHKGYLPSINSEMLARSFSYKPRKKKEEIKTIHKDNIIKKGRRYDDYKDFIENNPDCSVVEMDTVIGLREDKYCLLTLHIKKLKLFLIYKIEKYKPNSVIKVFNKIKDDLGDENFKIIFEVILTDNGWEFSKPLDIEINKHTGEKLVNLFYTDSYSSWQKGTIERHHQFIRYIIPKGITLDNLTKKNVIDIMNNINNVRRKSLDYSTPYKLFKDKYGVSVAKKLNLKYIDKDKVNLSYRLLK